MSLKSIPDLYRSKQKHEGGLPKPYFEIEIIRRTLSLFSFSFTPALLKTNWQVKVASIQSVPCCVWMYVQSGRVSHTVTARSDKYTHTHTFTTIKPRPAPRPAFLTSGEVRVYGLFRDSKWGWKFHSKPAIPGTMMVEIGSWEGRAQAGEWLWTHFTLRKG